MESPATIPVADRLDDLIRAHRELQLPHPLLGKLTLREMVAWSLYHGHHHRARIRERSQV